MYPVAPAITAVLVACRAEEDDEGASRLPVRWGLFGPKAAKPWTWLLHTSSIVITCKAKNGIPFLIPINSILLFLCWLVGSFDGGESSCSVPRRLALLAVFVLRRSETKLKYRTIIIYLLIVFDGKGDTCLSVCTYKYISMGSYVTSQLTATKEKQGRACVGQTTRRNIYSFIIHSQIQAMPDLWLMKTETPTKKVKKVSSRQPTVTLTRRRQR